ncbi:hypothetical protein ABMA28_007550 [Loxostege sticticalis]|uniref:Uncharacterized protein n=1 Tax=Loxostege sticticalis TaxID=481309 RepID=A0ABD0SHX8_LOXSC
MTLFVYGGRAPTNDCPPGEHIVLYCPQKAEPDCDVPTLHEPYFAACDLADCFCNEPTVRDISTGQCVELSKCPKKEK